MAKIRKTRFAILGLLSWQPMTGYDIKKLVELGLSHFWNESYGQLYPTLSQLVEEGLAVKKTKRQGNRKRHEFTITAAGRRAFLEWLQEPTEQPRVRSEFQLKFFHCGRRPVAEGIRLVEEYQIQQRTTQEMFVASESVLSHAIEHDVVPEELDSIVGNNSTDQLLFFLLSLRHGVLAVEARLAWCEETLAALKRLQSTHSKAAKKRGTG